MVSRLRRLLAAIAPVRTYDRLTRRAGEALASYRIQSARLTDWEAFRGCLIRFSRHMDHRLLGLPPSAPTDVELLWSRFVSVLNEIYGPSGAKAAYDASAQVLRVG